MAGLFLTGMLVLIGLTKTDRVNEPSQVPAGKALSEQRSTKKDNTALSISSTMRELLADESAKAILDRHLPGMSSDPQLQQAMGMSLKQVASYSQGAMSNGMLKTIDEELHGLPQVAGTDAISEREATRITMATDPR